jgi:hypothetical protein
LWGEGKGEREKEEEEEEEEGKRKNEEGKRRPLQGTYLKHLHSHVYCSTIYNSQAVEIAKMPQN